MTATDALAAAARGELLGPLEMGAIWHIGRSQFHRRNAAGEFDQFKLQPAIGPRCFSGVLVHRYVTGQPVYVPTFGKRRHA